jgi:hypothetical protein
VLRKAAPVSPADGIAEDLRAAIAAAPIRPRYMSIPLPLDAPFPAGDGFARLLFLATQLDPTAKGNEELLDSDAPGAQLVVIEHARGMIDGDWPIDPAVEHLFAIDRTVRRLERLKESRHPMVSLAARFTLGEVSAEEMPRCGDPQCAAHANERRSAKGGATPS